MSFAAAPAASAQENSLNNFYKPVCIESDMIQTLENAAHMRVNGELTADAYVTYFIQSGAGCTFNCEMGFDVNCDGKLGDYCPVEIDRDSVTGAGECIALSLVETDPASPPIVDMPTTLAHTGSETSIAMTGFWLVGTGATVMTVVRRRSSSEVETR